MDSQIVKTRRANLRTWMERHGTPSKERSYFSQLALGTAAFGEKAARRIEREYGMEALFLDTPQGEGAHGAAEAAGHVAEQAAAYERTELTRVNMEELALLTAFREATARGRQVIQAAAAAAEKQKLTAVRRHQG